MANKAKFYAQKLDEKSFDIEDKDGYREFQRQAKAGRYLFDIRRLGKEKSNKQVRMIFGHMIQQTIEQADDKTIGADDLLKYLVDEGIPKGVPITKDYLHALMYVICPTYDDDGKPVTLSKMTTVQAMDLFERFRTILAPLGIEIDDPNPN